MNTFELHVLYALLLLSGIGFAAGLYFLWRLDVEHRRTRTWLAKLDSMERNRQW